ncbi:hypothetical protein CDL15_Pgr027262 [Punica granatum]|uniref:Uncharacterized protein n=1 Tax=Punica granatum TaxID=22663 RepID=A0A218XMY9_PUNGR|nr:hypothetical protein CDL15_Pgr027262 [Punica granatum]
MATQLQAPHCPQCDQVRTFLLCKKVLNLHDRERDRVLGKLRRELGGENVQIRYSSSLCRMDKEVDGLLGGRKEKSFALRCHLVHRSANGEDHWIDGFMDFTNIDEDISEICRWDWEIQNQLLPRQILDRNSLVEELVGGNNGNDVQDNYQQVVVCGHGGSGRTMVVRAVYEHVQIKHHFDRRAWVSVPANFITNEVLRDLLVQLSPSGLKLDFTNSAKEEEELLGEELTKLLSGPGRYLIIMDDVKARDNAWKALTRYLHGTGGNRILINTGEVDPSTTLWAKTYDLGPLPWEVSLRAALCSNSASPGNSNSSIETLFWSCPRLSLQLKACFLYLFLFPRGFEISVRRALCLWVSEGFLDCKKVVQNNHPPPEPEDLARICFNKLFRAKLIEVIKWKLDGSPKTCRVPLFVHDNFYETSKNLFTVCQHEDDHQHLVRFVKYQDNASASHTNDQQLQDDLRSYICLSLKARGKTTKEIRVLDSMILRSRFALLKVLDLEGVYKPQLPDSMGKLTLLRLLGLRSTLIDSLPRSISELPNLETLDLKNTDVISIPSPIYNSGKLRHLYMKEVQIDSLCHKKISSNLRTLTGLCIGEGRSSPSGLERMNKLEKLKLRYHPTSVGGAAALVSQNTLLRSLRLSSTDPSDPYDCHEELNLSSHTNLQKLYLLTKLRLSEPETETLADQPAAAQNQPAVYSPEVESAAKPAEQLAFPGNQPDVKPSQQNSLPFQETSLTCNQSLSSLDRLCMPFQEINQKLCQKLGPQNRFNLGFQDSKSNQ